MKRVDLTEEPQIRLARLLREQDARLGRLETRPTGVKHLGADGDVQWRGPGWVVNPADPDGPLIPAQSWETWSVREVPQITETLAHDLDRAAERIDAARQDLAAVQDRIDGVSLDVEGLQGSIGQAAQDAADAQAAAGAALAAADDAAQAAADALEAAQGASGKQQIFFGPNPPPVGDPDVLWIDSDGIPHQWVGTPPDTGVWETISDARIVAAAAEAQAARDDAAAAAQAAQDAQAAADAAAQAAADAADAAAQALVSAAGRNSRIISLDPPSGVEHPQTGNELVPGDTWWQWDTTTDRNVIGAWVWNGDQWQPETLTNSVLGSLDLNKLLVLGEARMTEAVVQKIMGDAAYFNLINVEDLTVTGLATIDEAVVAKMAAAMIITQVLRTEVDAETSLYSIFDSFGLRVINNDGPDGDPVPIIQLGPSGTNLLQLGTPETGTATVDSAGGVTAVTGAFENLWVGGVQVGQDTEARPRGVVGRAYMHGNRSRKLNGRDLVLSIDVHLRPGRVYRLEASSMTVYTEHDQCSPLLLLHTAFDNDTRPWDDWGGTWKKQSGTGSYGDFKILPGMLHWIDLTNLDPAGPDVVLVGAVSLANYRSNGWVQVATEGDRIWLTVEDAGDRFEDLGNPWYDAGGGGSQLPPVHRTARVRTNGFANYLYPGGPRDHSPARPTQGQWSQWNRECMFRFPDMTGLLANATHIRRVTLSTWADHWGQATGNADWHWHGHSDFPGDGQQSQHPLGTSFRWAPGSRRGWDLHPSQFGLVKNGTMRGFGFVTPNTSHEYYGQFSNLRGPTDDATFIDLEWEEPA